jgi:hypothetical protein
VEAAIHPSKPSLFTLAVGIMLLSSMALMLVSCSKVQETNAQQVATNTPVPDLMKTAEVLSTRIARDAGIVLTAQAWETEEASRPTSAPTEIPVALPSQPPTSGTPSAAEIDPALTSVPPDIPVFDGNAEDLYVSPNFITYQVKIPMTKIVAFYQQEMIKNGWQWLDRGSYISQSSASLNYEKPDRKVNISLQSNPVSELTTVVITIQNR